MNEEIIEILEEMKEYASGGMTGLYFPEYMIQDLLDYITNLQEELENKAYEQLKTQCFVYKERIDKALSWTNRIIEIIKQQPSENDTWILENLQSIKYLLKGSDKE